MAIDTHAGPLDHVAAPTPTAHSPARRLLGPLFATTAFVGAALLFVVQPLVARLILPSYGGSATVWSTSSLFFQVLLLAAYGYAHLSTSRLGARWQPRAHLVVLLLPLVALPVALPGDVAPGPDVSPALWLLRTLVLVIGLPFLVVATTGPLLQRWYSWGDHRRAEDPYFLFAASNLGSFGGLLAYPLLIEPHLTLAQQRAWWSGGFALFVVLTAACALSVRGAAGPAPRRPRSSDRATRPRRDQVLRWTALAFLPSSLMLGVTAYVSTDVAAIPLLWVVPLAVYLATFVVAFARTSRTAPRALTQVAVAVAAATAVTTVAPVGLPVPAVIGLNLATLALVAYAAHARLAAERPPAEQLTAFYLVVASGGALGGLLNGLVAPLVLDRVVEYSLALAVVPLLLVGLAGSEAGWLGRHVRANRVRALLVASLVALAPLALHAAYGAAYGRLPLTVAITLVAVLLGWQAAYLPRILTAALVTLLVVGQLGDARGSLERSRTFFGSYQVRDLDGTHVLVHGTTTHGTQLRDDDRRDVPTTYYARSGPLGDVFAGPRATDVAVVGLGTGTVAAYGLPGQRMTFFEIDPEVLRIASDPRLFSYLEDSPASIGTVVGDGRLALAESPRGAYDVIVLDAFSSDAIPVHLLTEEAVRGYVSRLAPGGRLLVHISNRVFDLEPVLASASRRLGLAALAGHGRADGDGATTSDWIALARDDADLDHLAERPGWRGLEPRETRWTDDYSSILSVLR